MATNGRRIATTANGRVQALIESDALVIREFRETDPGVVRLAREAKDIEPLIHDLLVIGSRASESVRSTMDAELVQRAFDRMTAEMEASSQESLKEMKRTMATFLDAKDGVLARTLAAGRKDLELCLDDAFDADSKRSVMARFDALIEAGARKSEESFARLLDPSDERSPLGRYNTELLKGFKREFGPVRETVQEVSEKLAVREAEREVLERAAVKGGSFNDLVHVAVSQIAGPYGDLAEMTDRIPGALGSKKGDEVVTLDVEDTAGVTARFVLENKAGRLSMSKTLTELEAAMANREALAGVAVFAREADSPAGVPFTHNGNTAIVVFDRDELDDRLLWLAYLWARWTVRRQLSDERQPIDAEQISGLIDRIARALDKAVPLKRCLTGIGNQAQQGRRHLDQLLGDADAALEELRGLLDS